MVSGLYGHSLSEVKDYWKKTSNGQSSFARNPEATSSWLDAFSDHPKSIRLRCIVEFLPFLLHTERLDRPSAQMVVDNVHNLSLRLRDAPHLANACCGLAARLSDDLLSMGVREVDLPKSDDPQIYLDIACYFDALADNLMTYIVLDQRFKQVAAKHDCYSDMWETLSRRILSRSDVSSIEAACEMLFLRCNKTEPILDHPHSQTDAPTGLDLDQALRQVLDVYTSWQAIFTALSVELPTSQEPWRHQVSFTTFPSIWHKRTVQISMVGLEDGHRDNCDFSSVFYVLAFKIYEEGYEPSKLGAPCVDLTQRHLGAKNDGGPLPHGWGEML